MIKNILLGVAIIVFTLMAFWAYSWHIGKTAPSEQDVSTVEVNMAVAYFAGGCFWCVESDYEKLSGVLSAVSGYMGGSEQNPSYNQVSGGNTLHRESVKVVYDPTRITYQELVFHLIRHTDPTDAGGSFFDRGFQYTSAVFYQSEEEKSIAESVVQKLEQEKVFDAEVVTNIEKAGVFWVAEEYHQDYYKKNPLPYQYYRRGSGRDAFTDSVWNGRKYEDFFTSYQKETMSSWKQFRKPDDETLPSALTSLQYDITQKEGTETPFQNEYWDNHEEGIYVDIVSGEPLFSSTDKFDSGTGWPSFLKPIDMSFVTEHKDFKLIIPRTEVRSKIADSHLGHIILDGPIENDKIRYCMNSASLRFVPKEDMEAQGYVDFLRLFTE